MPARWRLGHVATLLGAALLAACTSATPASSPSSFGESETPLPSTSVAPSTSAQPSEATPSGQLLDGYGYDDLLRVDVNGLAVRRKPYLHIPLATGYTLDGTSIGDVRLNEGDFVSVDLGPLVIGETTWYRVWPAEGGQRHYSTVLWDTLNNGPNPVEPGWVAASVGTDTYLSLHDAFVYDPAIGTPPPLLLAGIGDHLSAQQEGFDLFLLNWAYAIDDQFAPCDFTVRVVHAGAGAGLVAADHSTIGAFEEGRDSVHLESFEPYQLAVSSGCEWTLSFQALGHD